MTAHVAPGRTRIRRPALPSLTGLRFFAAMMVVFFHVWLPTKVLARSVADLASLGYLGVSLFFVLSGYILTYTYLIGTPAPLIDAREFWRARFRRVYPAYVLALVIAAPVFWKQHLVGSIGTDSMHGGAAAAVLSPALLQAWWPDAACRWNCPGWSLSVEAFFYAVFPWLGPWVCRGAPRSALLRGATMWMACLLFPMCYLLIQPDGPGIRDFADAERWLDALKYSPVVHVGQFALGIGVARWQWSTTPTTERLVARAGVIALVGLAALPVLSRFVPYELLHSGLAAPLFAAGIAKLAQGRGTVARTLGAAPIVAMGEASYSLYLLHLPLAGYVWYAAARLDPSGGSIVMFATIATLLSLIVSVLTYRYYELPASQWLRQRAVTPLPDSVN